jgi:hypothetical protein
VDSNKRFEEIQIGEFSGFRIQFAHGQGFGEHLSDLHFIVGLYPDKDEVHVALGKRPLSRLNDWSVHPVAVGKGAL